MPLKHNCMLRSVWQQALAGLPWTPAARALALQKNIGELWARQQSDDLLYIFLSVIDAYITKACQACITDCCHDRLLPLTEESMKCRTKACGLQGSLVWHFRGNAKPFAPHSVLL